MYPNGFVYVSVEDYDSSDFSNPMRHNVNPCQQTSSDKYVIFEDGEKDDDSEPNQVLLTQLIDILQK